MTSFWETNKTNWRATKKTIDAILNQNKRLATLTNTVYHKDNYKEIFAKLVKERYLCYKGNNRWTKTKWFNLLF